MKESPATSEVKEGVESAEVQDEKELAKGDRIRQ